MSSILSQIKNNNFIPRLIFFMIGAFFAALIYNMIFVPNNIVVGGVSGLAIIVKKLTGLSTTIFIDVCNIFLIIISIIVLGKKKTLAQLVGCIMYPLMITLTAPLANVITIRLESTFLLIIIATILYGLASGLIYRAGYSTGGSDIVIEILSYKKKRPITFVAPILHIAIIIAGGIVFSPIKIMYAIFIIYLSNLITDRVLFGISTSKMVYVVSAKNRDMEDYIMNKIHTGATEIKISSGLFEKKKQMLLCVVHNSQYNKFKRIVLHIDPNAFIVTNNCYEVKGGTRENILPF